MTYSWPFSQNQACNVVNQGLKEVRPIRARGIEPHPIRAGGGRIPSCGDVALRLLGVQRASWGPGDPSLSLSPARAVGPQGRGEDAVRTESGAEMVSAQDMRYGPLGLVPTGRNGPRAPSPCTQSPLYCLPSPTTWIRCPVPSTRGV